MGLLVRNKEERIEYTYSEMRKHLARRDGKLHVVMINSFSRFQNKHFACETKYTDQIDMLLSFMQRDGYNIVDVKFNSIPNQGVFNMLEGFHTLITYE